MTNITFDQDVTPAAEIQPSNTGKPEQHLHGAGKCCSEETLAPRSEQNFKK